MSLTHVGDSPLIRYLASERAAEDYTDEIVDGQGRLQYLDQVPSVSASEPSRATLWLPASQLEKQRRRHLHSLPDPEVTDGS